VNHATEIAKALKEVSSSLEKAEAKLKIAELMESLAEAKMAAAEVQETIREKDVKIAELEKAIQLKSKLVKVDDAFYELNHQGEPFGSPYCMRCLQVDHRAVSLSYGLHARYIDCPECESKFDTRRARFLKGNGETGIEPTRQEVPTSVSVPTKDSW
jgi:hypothetical protein